MYLSLSVLVCDFYLRYYLCNMALGVDEFLRRMSEHYEVR